MIRAARQPAVGDDSPRSDRPAGWLPDRSREAVVRRFEAPGGAIGVLRWERMGRTDELAMLDRRLR